jgi:ADP-ribose pyrophosphatase YjhB (NUDIX family)
VPDHPPVVPGDVLRHFTVAVFVVHQRRVLLHYHRKLGKWLPPGGHIEDNELPDEAALREVREETGVEVELVGPFGLAEPPVDAPRQLIVPAGIQVEPIYAGHEHIDLVYFARPVGPVEIDVALAESDQVAWYGAEDLPGLGASEEIQTWALRALDTLSVGC